MEQLNRVELRGIVGSSRISKVGDTTFVQLTVATNLAYRAQDGTPVIETTWHNVKAFESSTITGLENIGKGDRVYVTGRIRNQRYTAESGEEKTMSEIRASRLVKLDTDEPLQYEM